MYSADRYSSSSEITTTASSPERKRKAGDGNGSSSRDGSPTKIQRAQQSALSWQRQEREQERTSLSQPNNNNNSTSLTPFFDRALAIREREESVSGSCNTTGRRRGLSSVFQKRGVSDALFVRMSNVDLDLKKVVGVSVALLCSSWRPESSLLDRQKGYLFRAEGTSSGCYFLKGQDGQNALVAKPALQERGATDCPVATVFQIEGITPGQGAFREWLACKIQEFLGVDFGVPRVALAEMSHPYFKDRLHNPIILGLDKLNSHMSKNDRVKPWTEHSFLGAMIASSGNKIALIKLIQDHMRQDVYALGLDPQQQEAFIFFCQKNKAPVSPKKMLEVFEGPDGIPELKGRINEAHLTRAWALLEKQVGMESVIGDLYDAFTKEPPAPVPTLVSLQEFKHDTNPLPDGESCTIADAEFSKFALDIILTNKDRSRGNILIDGQNRVILIDHGLILPDPLFANDLLGMQAPCFEFMEYSQAKRPLQGPIRDALARLDVVDFLMRLRFAVGDLQAEFADPFTGEVEYMPNLSLSEDHYTLLAFNLYVLKKGIEHGRTLYDIAYFYSGDVDGDVAPEAPKVLSACVDLNKQLQVQKLHSLLDNKFRQ